MAERKSGPVKPPVIDLTARPAGAKPAVPESAAGAEALDKGGPKPADKDKPVPPRPPGAERPEPPPPPRRDSRWLAAGAGGIGGAILAIAVCYLLADAGLWPVDTKAVDARLAALDSGLAQSQQDAAAATTALAGVNTRLAGLETDFAAKLAAASSTLTTMQDTVAKLQQAPAPAVDLGPIQAQLKTLSARVDAVAAGASSADAGALAANIATVQQNLADLSQKVAALGDRAGSTDSAMQSLKAELDSAKGAIDQAAAAPSPRTIASAMQLPLLISALDADFAAGRPYDADLHNLVAAMPEAHVPAAVGDAAVTGLPSPEGLVATFEARMPDIIAARPVATDSSWSAQLGGWMKSVLALRQQGEHPGDDVDAVLSRLEPAVQRHDFAAAATLLGQLPPPMQQAAGDVAPRLKALAEAQAFVAGLRKTALAPAAGVQQ